MTIGVGGAGCKIAVKLDPEAVLVNVSGTELAKVDGGGMRIEASLRGERGQFQGARKDPRIGHDAYLSVRRQLSELIRGAKVFSSTGGGTGTGIVTGIMEELAEQDEIATEDKTFFGLVLPYAELESSEFVRNSSEFMAGALAKAIDSGNTGNIVLFSNKKKFEDKIAEDEYNTMLVDSLNVLLSIPQKNAELKLLEGHIDPEDFTLFLAKPYFNHFCYFDYDPDKSFDKQLAANRNELLLESDGEIEPIEAMFLLEVPAGGDSTIFYDIVQSFSDKGVSPIYSVVENPELDSPFITVSLLYSRKPKETVSDFNRVTEQHANTKVKKSLDQYVELDHLHVNLEKQARAAAKTRGDEEEVLAVLKRIGKL